MLLRARIVLPLSGPAIADGAVLIAENRVAAIGPWRDLSQSSSEPVVDLGAVILLPGLVNAHCHLDYTDMLGEPAPKQFPDWIKGLLARKAGTIYADYAQAWLRGAAMLLRNGTTTVADIEAVPELLPEVWTSTPLRVASFLEMTGVQSRRDPDAIVQEATAKIDSLPKARGFAGLSPHALYSTHPALLTSAARVAQERRFHVTMHVAESTEEFEMYANRRGAMFDWMKGQRDMADCGGATPMQQVHRNGLMNGRFLAVHANYLQPGDVELLAQTGASVAHCPRSHAYFCHQPFLYPQLKAAGVNVCLGTDSLASVTPERGANLELNMFVEMQTFAAKNPGVNPGEILRMATINGARALGLTAKADLISIPFEGEMKDAAATVVQHPGPARHSMIDGQFVLFDGAPAAHNHPA